ncbi:MAG: acetyltransferase [Lentisphaeraceae bacterium]|nr:acetyltransferase [Lentisphaeraceae bacterium]
MSKRFYLYGSGGHSKVLIDIAKMKNISITGLFDDDEMLWQTEFYGIPVLGGFKAASDISKGSSLSISIGCNNIRAKIVEKLLDYSYSFETLIHPNSVVSASVKIDSGSCLMAGTVVNADTKIGKHCIINTNSNIDHDCILKDYVHVSPGASICGGVKVGQGTLIGAGATIIPGITIGKNCIIGAGSVVIRDVPDGNKVVGNPARLLSQKINIIGNE